MNTPAGKSSLCFDCKSDIFWKCPWVMFGQKPDYAKFESTPVATKEIYQFDTVEKCVECKKLMKEKLKVTKQPKKYVGRSRKVIARLPNERKYLHKFDSIKEASEKMYINKRSISRALKGDLKTAGGYVWRYARTRKKEVTND